MALWNNTTRKNSSHFERQLERGLEYEQGAALATLHEKFPTHYIINNKTDPVKTTGGSVVGPRMYKGLFGEEEHILPDYLLIDEDGKNMWIDAKLKGKTYWRNNKEFFTLDRKKHAAYVKLPAHVRNNFFLLFFNEKNGKTYLAKFNPTPDTVYYDNQYGSGDTPIYYVKDITQI